ncbi:hypothetical protein J7F03_17125 [Streptomyces sp. ISL-43]|uniref:hypothetical protein n=1 Tax=Streptomyces sp. ISL-43 TaxID=2819183 RepID=UPI001BE9B111|nr:hypothetical protein [Streptomyces sp. ISL-43]MBT2448782.1 hypothetical protein [Streptomyces sp. ISL-43]
MHRHRALTLLAAAGILALTACEVTEPPSLSPTATPSTPTSEPAAPPAVPPAPTTKAPAPAPAAATAAVPNAIGHVLQTAQDNAQAAGFYYLGSTDALGQSRMQVLDRNWTVCSQTPAAGTQASTDTKIVFNTVKLGETCP